MSALQDYPRQVEGLAVEETKEGFVIREADRTHHLNRTAAVILAMCGGDFSANDIHATLIEVEGPNATPKEHVALCLDQLRRRGLITMPSQNGAADGPR